MRHALLLVLATALVALAGAQAAYPDHGQGEGTDAATITDAPVDRVRPDERAERQPDRGLRPRP